MNAICVFLLRNPVSALLGDVYHSVHTRNHNGRGELVWCCAPLLYIWFKSHLPTKGAFVETRDSMRCSKRLMGLTSQDIVWYEQNLERKESQGIICSCGEFPNVPFLGMRGGINYNPILLRRQLEYALKGPPEDKEVVESFFYIVGEDVEVVKRVVRAWNYLRYKGKQHFGKRDCAAYSPYKEWIKNRVKTVYLPFSEGKLLYPQEPEHPGLILKGQFDKITLTNRSLIQEKEDMSIQVYEARHEKKKLVHKVKEKNELLQKLHLMVNTEAEKRFQVEDSRGISSETFENQKRALEEAERRFVAKKRECGNLKRSMKRAKNEYKAKIQKLESQLKEENMRRVEVEGQLKRRDVQMDKVLEDVAGLREQLQTEGSSQSQIPLPECDECEKLINHFQYLESMIFQKDVLIQSLIQRRNSEEIKKMFEESKAWSLKHLNVGGPLTFVD